MLEAERQFRKIIGYTHLAALALAVEADVTASRATTTRSTTIPHRPHHHDRPGRYARSRSLISGSSPKFHGERDNLFTAADAGEARRRLGDAVTQLQARLPKLAALLEDAEDDVLAFYAFPAEHWPKLRSTNPLERFIREIGRRTDVVGIFPDDASLIRLVSMLAIEANDEWLVGRSYISQGSMAGLYDQQSGGSLFPI